MQMYRLLTQLPVGHRRIRTVVRNRRLQGTHCHAPTKLQRLSSSPNTPGFAQVHSFLWWPGRFRTHWHIGCNWLNIRKTLTHWLEFGNYSAAAWLIRWNFTATSLPPHMVSCYYAMVGVQWEREWTPTTHVVDLHTARFEWLIVGGNELQRRLRHSG